MPSGFEDLRAFLAVAESGSFLAAANRLGVSRTTLRRQVEALEAQAGVPLLQRISQGISLTDAGKKLLGSGRAMEREFSALLHAVRETGHRPEGEVRVIIQIGLPPPVLVMLYGFFCSSWPELMLRLRFSEDPVTLSSEAEVVIWMGEPELNLAWESYTISMIPIRLFASPAYLEEHGTPKTLDDLNRHRLMAWARAGEKEVRVTSMSGRTHLIHPVLTSTDIHLLHEFAHAGHGIAWAPDADLPLLAGRETCVLQNLIEGETALRVAVPRVLSAVPKVRVFIENLQQFRAVIESPG